MQTRLLQYFLALEREAHFARAAAACHVSQPTLSAAMPAIGFLVQALLDRHPVLNTSVRALTSRQIERELAAFELDAGLTYLDFEPPSHALAVPLYVERYKLVAARGVSGRMGTD